MILSSPRFCILAIIGKQLIIKICLQPNIVDELAVSKDDDGDVFGFGSDEENAGDENAKGGSAVKTSTAKTTAATPLHKLMEGQSGQVLSTIKVISTFFQ